MWFVLSSPNLFWQSNKLAEKLQKNCSQRQKTAVSSVKQHTIRNDKHNPQSIDITMFFDSSALYRQVK